MASLKELSSVLIIASKQSAEQLSGMLDNMQYYPIKIVNSAGEARRILSSDSFDIVIINAPLVDEQGYELALDIAEDSNSGVLLCVKNEIYDETRYRVEDVGVFTISKPFSLAMFQTGLNMVNASRRKIAILERENEKLRSKIDEMRIVNRAKWVLIDKKQMSETEAHRYIEKGSMDARLSRKEFAKSVIEEYED